MRKQEFDQGRITKIADLKGKRIANGSPGTGALGTLNRMLKTAGLTLKDGTGYEFDAIVFADFRYLAAGQHVRVELRLRVIDAEDRGTIAEIDDSTGTQGVPAPTQQY